MATATLTSTQEVLPSFVNAGRAAGMFGVKLYSEQYLLANAKTPGATAADNVLAAYTLPGGSLNQVGYQGSPNGTTGLRIRAIGRFAATANNKTVKIIFNATTATVGSTVSGGTTIASTGVVAINNLGFVMEAFVQKIGVPNSNTQLAGQVLNIAGATIVSPPITLNTTATEASDIIIAVTGNAATATSDILLDYFEVMGHF